MKAIPIPAFMLAIVAYSVLSFVIFGLAYMAIGMEQNFDVGSTKASNASHAFYHSWCVQSTCMDEMAPKTMKGRVVQGCHVAAAWLPTAIMLAPWFVTRK